MIFYASSYQYSSYHLNCTESLFINEKDKTSLCNNVTTGKVMRFFPSWKNHRPLYNLRTALNYTCKPTCTIGHTIYFDKFSWKCILCPNNSVKTQLAMRRANPANVNGKQI